MIPKWWLFRSNGYAKFYWDILIIMLATYNIFAIPYVIVFDAENAETVIYKFVIWIIALIFILDIILNFFTSYVN